MKATLNPWYVILWRLIWWVPTWGTLAVFCVLISIYTLSIEYARDAWRSQT
jgi:hypothetical protein